MKISKRAFYRLLGIIFALVAYFALLTGISYSRAPDRYRMHVLDKFTISNFSPMDGAAGGLDPLKSKIHFQNEQDGSLVGYSVEIALPNVRSVGVDLTLDCAEGYENSVLCIDLCGENYDNPEQEHQEVLQVGMEEISVSLPTGEDPPDKYDLRIFTLDRCDLTIGDLNVFLLTDGLNATIVVSYLSACVTALVSVAFFRKFSKCQ